MIVDFDESRILDGFEILETFVSVVKSVVRFSDMKMGSGKI